MRDTSRPAREWLALALAPLLFASFEASAQDVPTSASAAPSDALPAALEGTIDEARRRFQQGLALAEAGNCQGALAELEASLALVPRPNTVFNIAQCQEELHRYDLALASYGHYLELVPTDDPERGRVERTMRSLRGLLGTIRVRANVEAEVWLDDRVVGRAPGQVLVPGGTHVLELRANGYLPQRREVTVAAQREVDLDVTLEEATRQVTIEQSITQQVERPPLPVAVVASGTALALASIGVGTGFGVSALLARDAQRALHPGLPRDPAAIDEAAMLADVFFLAGGVLGVGSLVCAFLTDFDGPEEAGPPSGGDAPAVEVSVSTSGVRVRGRF